MKKIYLLLFCCLAFAFGAAAQQLNCDIHYTFLREGTLLNQHHQWIFCNQPKPDPDIEFDLLVDKEFRKDSFFTFHFFMGWESANDGELWIETSGLCDPKGYVHVKLNECLVTRYDHMEWTHLKYSVQQITYKNDKQKGKSKEQFLPENLRDRFCEFCLSFINDIDLSTVRDFQNLQIQINLRQLTSGNVRELVDMSRFNVESILCKYDLRLDKDKNFLLRVIGSDGNKLADYKVSFNDVIFKFAKLKKLGTNLSYFPNPVFQNDVIESAIAMLTEKFKADAAVIEKINNQKEKMQNKYRNDTERLDAVKDNLEFNTQEMLNR